MVGAQTNKQIKNKHYSLMRNLLSPERPGEKTLLKNHFNPRPSKIVQRFKFDSRMRRPTQSVAELRKLAGWQEDYGETLPQMLQDRLVCGINEDRIQRRLVSETDLTFESALSLAQAMESANKNVQDLQAKAGAMSCNAVRAGGAESMGQKRGSKGRSEKDKDGHCCRGKHAPEDCRFKKEKCHACGMAGHIA